MQHLFTQKIFIDVYYMCLTLGKFQEIITRLLVLWRTLVVWEGGELSGHLRVHTAKLKCLGSQSNIWIYIQTDNVYAFIQILFIVEC